LSGRQVALPVSADEQGPVVRLYVCGITPYDSGHMGHAFTYAAFDVLVRHLESGGHRVRYVQNVTDVDDPLFERARREGVEWKLLAQVEQRRFLEDMAQLGWRPPDVMPRVSEEIASILESVRQLDRRGHAYRSDALYFAASTYKSYGRLSKRSRRSMIAKLRGDDLLGRVGPGAKRDALDFALWRPSRADEPAWRSEFGEGRPGWHIECSAMSMRHLGPQVDIHGGGRDLVFSHHESERAQSESLTGMQPFARAWMHTGLVRYERRKMSKSLGNLVLAREAVRRSSPAAVRLYLASHHYRRDWEFTWRGLQAAGALAARIRSLVGAARPAADPRSAAVKRFRRHLDDDLDTPGALRVLRTAAREGDAPGAAWMLRILAGDAEL
jgi:L-cysteine:1D-myo-inositol 2-amino-2-deoxy-alpha-D-glucopyranoside ligase